MKWTRDFQLSRTGQLAQPLVVATAGATGLHQVQVGGHAGAPRVEQEADVLVRLGLTDKQCVALGQAEVVGCWLNPREVIRAGMDHGDSPGVNAEPRHDLVARCLRDGHDSRQLAARRDRTRGSRTSCNRGRSCPAPSGS